MLINGYKELLLKLLRYSVASQVVRMADFPDDLMSTAKNGVKYGKCGFPSISVNGKIDGH